MGGKVDLLGSFSISQEYLELERTVEIGTRMLDNTLMYALEMYNIVDIQCIT